MRPVIELHGVSAGYTRGKPVLQDVDFSVERSAFTAVIGPNGGGKTTLLKVILGLLQPRTGTVSVLGTTPEKARLRIGYVPQIIPEKTFPVTVMDVVLMGRMSNTSFFGGYSSEDSYIAGMNLERLGILELSRTNMDSLSGGQKQRVLIARALSSEPEILLLDEPVASVDHDTQESFFNLLAELNSSITILLVTHDVGAVSSHVGNIACINRTIISHGSTISADAVSKAYGCPFELISHGGVPHRVLDRRNGDDS